MPARTNRLLSWILGAAPAAIGVAWSTDAAADLVIQDLNATVEVDQPVQFDLNKDGFNDFEIGILNPDLFESRIIPLHQGASIIGALAFEVATAFGPGDRIDDTSGESTAVAILSGVDGAPFNEIGSTGYVGLGLSDSDESINFGWAEISRGSIILGQVGFETTPGAPAVIPIPEPTALALASLGLTALLRRRAR